MIYSKIKNCVLYKSPYIDWINIKRYAHLRFLLLLKSYGYGLNVPMQCNYLGKFVSALKY